MFLYNCKYPYLKIVGDTNMNNNLFILKLVQVSTYSHTNDNKYWYTCTNKYNFTHNFRKLYH